MVLGPGSSDALGLPELLVYDAGRDYDPRSCKQRASGGFDVQDTDTKTESTTNNQIVFPMAVGLLFLVVLVAGALLG